ncbi:alpha/beta-hydrolase [Exidia glandulosa HHB12029]|uniref:Carboxypeptidase n=1 Tax=Exidia glandulosa HHB12029 TaxID=1314781 RepID=A0A165MGR6_EXIGL|nr:alpha/beta-hydrolase [Exidia glandulosa HHB12029]
MKVAQLVSTVAALVSAVAAVPSFQELEARRAAALERHAAKRDARVYPKRQVTTQPTISFSNPKAAEFFVDGCKDCIPEVHFDVGPSWSGLMPISSAPNPPELFFWYWPAKHAENADDLVFWTNGGPGCSSLMGMLQENGPFTWPPGTGQPIENQWSWTNLSNVLWVEQPVGTGFSQGEVDIMDDDALAAQITGFLQQFLNVFSELKGKNLYLAGESYAGYYVPYLANYLYENPHELALNMKGIWLADPTISWDVVQQYIPAYAFVEKWKDVFAFSQEFMLDLRNASEFCGYNDYMDQYLTYPPKGPLPLPEDAFYGLPGALNISQPCATWDSIAAEAVNVNPNFNYFRILDTWPVSWDVLGVPGSFLNKQSPIYFNRTDVQDVIHAPRMSWQECSVPPVYVNRTDYSMPSSLTVLPSVIEKNVRTVIMHGLLDFILLSDGTRIAIQNMTWGGLQGFQTPIQPDTFKIDGFGTVGAMHEERKLTYIEVNLAGHMLPQYAPWAAYKSLAYLLGHQELNSTALDALLYPNDQQLYGRMGSMEARRRLPHFSDL